jgi:hypothetical protein
MVWPELRRLLSSVPLHCSVEFNDVPLALSRRLEDRRYRYKEENMHKER